MERSFIEQRDDNLCVQAISNHRLEEKLESRCAFLFSYSGRVFDYVDLSGFHFGSPGCAFSQCSRVQFTTNQPIRRAALSRGSRVQTV